ncbi:MAG: tetratricopeptide repeat protein [candidate division WOR-3 bacterium]|nr:MAG: tetratricopeptide repeat protein [candidate division WOR-3 bacterium]
MLLLLVCSLVQVQDLYRSGEYEQVVEQSAVLLADARTIEDSVEAYRLRGFALVALGRNREAAAAFEGLLDVAPGHELDPETVSPKIRAVFDQVKAGRKPKPEPFVQTEVRTDKVRVGHRASLSVLVPGLAQIRNRKPVRGYLLLGAGAVSVAGLVFTYVNYQQAHDQYLAATELQEIEDRYRTANTWYQARSVSIGTTGAIWLYSLVDALLDL